MKNLTGRNHPQYLIYKLEESGVKNAAVSFYLKMLKASVKPV